MEKKIDVARTSTARDRRPARRSASGSLIRAGLPFLRLPALLIGGLMVLVVSCASATPPFPLPKFPAATSTPAKLPTATPAVTPTPIPVASTPTPTSANGSGISNAEKAHEQFRNEGYPTVLIMVDEASTGIEGEIYRDLKRRDFRMTTGPDEGIDTRGMSCYPNCVFVLKEAADASSVESWLTVLRHEYRHIVQATNNPDMAKDFREPNGRFTPYAAFSEVCADYGLNAAREQYRAQERMDELKSILGTEGQPLIDQACLGHKTAFQELVAAVNQRKASDQAFEQIFPPFD